MGGFLMIELIGKYNKAKIMIDNVDGDTISQVYNILNNPAVEGAHISIMPDCHVGNGVVVGFTMKINKFIVPAVIGVDIGCGIEAYKLGRLKKLKLDKFDDFIRKNIPSGVGIRKKATVELAGIYDVCKKLNLRYNEIICGIGSLGGGNHFIELDKDEENNIWLVIHTGSRRFGYEVAKYHQYKAKELMKDIYIGSAYNGLEYLTYDNGGKEYIDDMQLAQRYAELNRTVIARDIIEGFFKLRYEDVEVIKSVHNYINLEDRIIRKGAISAHKGEKVIIPFNMSFGCLIGVGKGNETYNYSAPHGAGRVMSRSAAKDKISLEIFQKSMKGIFSTTVCDKTIDEAPMAYKKPKVILENIKDTVEEGFLIKPVYNFKAVS